MKVRVCLEDGERFTLRAYVSNSFPETQRSFNSLKVALVCTLFHHFASQPSGVNPESACAQPLDPNQADPRNIRSHKSRRTSLRLQERSCCFLSRNILPSNQQIQTLRKVPVLCHIRQQYGLLKCQLELNFTAAPDPSDRKLGPTLTQNHRNVTFTKQSSFRLSDSHSLALLWSAGRLRPKP